MKIDVRRVERDMTPVTCIPLFDLYSCSHTTGVFFTFFYFLSFYNVGNRRFFGILIPGNIFCLLFIHSL